MHGTKKTIALKQNGKGPMQIKSNKMWNGKNIQNRSTFNKNPASFHTMEVSNIANRIDRRPNNSTKNNVFQRLGFNNYA